MSSFRREEVDWLLVSCYRRCCICHRFCGVKIETDHIVPQADGGTNEIENAIAVCFECHAEIHGYNDRHPRGRKFRPEELKRHKEQWLSICANNREIFRSAHRDTGVGPLQALVDELEFNSALAVNATQPEPEPLGCLFLDDQFRRAIHEGGIAMLQEPLKQAILDAYAAIGKANQHILAFMPHPVHGDPWAGTRNRAQRSVATAKEPIEAARKQLLEFLGSEPHSD